MRPGPEYRVVVAKAARRLRLYAGEELLEEFPVAIGRNALADKQVEGDEATPLGDFTICAKNPRSRYCRSLCLSYPNAEDAERGLRTGLIDLEEHAAILAALAAGRVPPQKTRLGGEIYLHGRAAPGADGATRGCIALSDAAILRLFDLLALGTPVTILP
jgi:murein L,D-transpeptidase YafK